LTKLFDCDKKENHANRILLKLPLLRQTPTAPSLVDLPEVQTLEGWVWVEEGEAGGEKMKCHLCGFKREEPFPYDSEGDYCPKCKRTQPKEKIMLNQKRIEFIARIRHLGWICYQMGAGQSYNIEIKEDQWQSLLNGVEYALRNPGMTPEENHKNWMVQKVKQGWVYGLAKDFDKKTHPDLVPFDHLPRIEQDKDIMDSLMNNEADQIWTWLQD